MAIIDELVAILGFKIEGEENVKKFKANMDSMEKQASSFGAKVGTALGLAGGAIITGLGFLAKNVVSVSGQFETYLATLETIEGSSEKAEKAFSWITKFAAETPFEVDELTRAFVKLRSYGLDPMDGSMKVMGDAASGMGKSIDQVVEAVADAATMQFERLKEFGIKAKQAGDNVTFAWTENGKDMSKTVAKTSTEITKFLYEVWGGKFNGAMIRQSKTWRGMLSNLSDTWTMFQYKIGKAGFFDTVKNKLAGFMEELNNWLDNGGAEAASRALSKIFTNAANAIALVIRQLVAHIKYLSANWDKFSGTLKLMAIGFAAASLAARPLLVTLGLLVLIFDDLLTYLEGGDSYFGDFVNKLKEFKGMGEGVAQSIAGVGTALLALFAISPVQFTKIGWRLGKALVSGFIFLLRWAGSWVLRGILALLPSVAEGVAAIVALVSNPVGWAVMAALVVAAIATAIWYFWDEIKALWNRFIAWFASTDFGKYVLEKLQQIKEAFASFVEMHVVGVQMGIALGKGILDGITQMGGQIKDYILSLLPEKVQSWFKSPANGIADMAANYSNQNQGGTSNTSENRNWNLIQPASPGLLAKINADKGTTNNTSIYNVQAPVNVNVQQATGAPGCVADAIAGTIKGLPMAPTRMQTGGAM